MITEAQNQNLIAQIQTAQLQLMINTALNKLGIKTTILHDQVIIDPKNDEEVAAALKVLQDIFDKAGS